MNFFSTGFIDSVFKKKVGPFHRGIKTRQLEGSSRPLGCFHPRIFPFQWVIFTLERHSVHAWLTTAAARSATPSRWKHGVLIEIFTFRMRRARCLLIRDGSVSYANGRREGTRGAKKSDTDSLGRGFEQWYRFSNRMFFRMALRTDEISRPVPCLPHPWLDRSSLLMRVIQRNCEVNWIHGEMPQQFDPILRAKLENVLAPRF